MGLLWRHPAVNLDAHTWTTPTPTTNRKKRALASFVGLAAVGLIVGLSVGLNKPERAAKDVETPVKPVGLYDAKHVYVYLD